ncbi:MAG TPA: hypothetical protein VHZ32_08185 [Rhizomicrobium sp.]|nr:hypothetical protein [Rhizomicrobium sp.]
MNPRLRVNTRRLFPFVLFQSLGQLAYWLALVAALAAVASLIFHERDGRLFATVIGGVVGSLFAWIPLLPYELRLEPADLREGLVRVTTYLVRSNFGMPGGPNFDQIGVGEWTSNRKPLFGHWKGNEVQVSVDGNAIVVRGPRSMIKPLWRNFRGPWQNMLALA